MAFKSLKAWWRRRRLRQADVAPAPDLHPERVGDGGAWDGWHVLRDRLPARPLAYSFGIGTDASFDFDLARRFNAEVHAFDPTPESRAWLERQALPPGFHFHPLGLAGHDGTLKLFPPKKPGRVNYSQERLEYVTADHQPIELPVARLSRILQDLGHARLDVLKIDIEGSEFEAIPDALEAGCVFDQLLVEVHYHYPTRSFAQGETLFRRILGAGYRCFHVSQRGYEFGFVRS